jgi:hypothetical protein
MLHTWKNYFIQCICTYENKVHNAYKAYSMGEEIFPRKEEGEGKE